MFAHVHFVIIHLMAFPHKDTYLLFLTLPVLPHKIHHCKSSLVYMGVATRVNMVCNGKHMFTGVNKAKHG